VVGTVLIKPQYKALTSASVANNAQKALDVAGKQQPAENMQEHFSPEHVTQQTLANVTGDIDITDNIKNALSAYNNNVTEFTPLFDYAQAAQENAGSALPVTADAKGAAKKETGSNIAKNTASVINWMNLVPADNIMLDGRVLPLLPGSKTFQKSATGGFMFSIFSRLQSSSYNNNNGISPDNNFSQPVHKTFTFKPNSRRFDFAFYASPSISYRSLNQTIHGANYISGIPYNAGYTVDLHRATRNKPATGYEVGAAIGYKLNDILTLRGGFQFNMREYDIQAYKQKSDPGTLGLFPGSIPGGYDVSNQTLTALNATDKVILQNRYYEISMPVGIDITAWKSGQFAWGVATAVQPTYTFDKDPFIVTTDYKNYIDGSKLVRNWNINSNFETYISYATGQFKWQIGPQFRYQLLSTLSGNYPIREHLLDYGIKIGFVKSLP
jgi:hypothetical protein